MAFPSSFFLVAPQDTRPPCCRLPVAMNAHDDHTGHIFYHGQLAQHAGSLVRSPGLALLCSPTSRVQNRDQKDNLWGLVPSVKGFLFIWHIYWCIFTLLKRELLPLD